MSHMARCEGCDAKVNALRSDARYCSSPCRQRAYRRRTREAQAEAKFLAGRTPDQALSEALARVLEMPDGVTDLAAAPDQGLVDAVLGLAYQLPGTVTSAARLFDHMATRRQVTGGVTDIAVTREP